MFQRRRGVNTLLLILFVVLGSSGSLAPAAAQDLRPIEPTATTESAEPTAEQPTDIPVDPTDEPVEPTEAPAEPTDVPPTEEPAPTETTEPVATETVPSTATTASTVTATATDEPDFSAAQELFEPVTVEFIVCENSDRVGQSDFFISGNMSAMDISTGCADPASPLADGLLVSLAGDSGSYTAPVAGRYAEFEGVEEGTYTLSWYSSTNPGATMTSTATLEFNGDYFFRIVYYVAAGTPGEVIDPAGRGSVSGNHATCMNPARDGQADFLFSEISAQAEATECRPTQRNMASVTLSGDPLDPELTFTPFTVVVDYGGEFRFDNVPYGTYTLTDTTSGAVSASFLLGESGDGSVELEIWTYYAEEPDLGAVVNVQARVCIDDERVGEVDYTIYRNLFSATATCQVVQDFMFPSPFNVTLGSGDVTYDHAFFASNNQVMFGPVEPGTYTLTAQGQIPNGAGTADYNATSDEIEVGNAETILIEMIIYTGGESELPPPTGDEMVVTGVLMQCESPDRVGQVDFVLGDFFATDTSVCDLLQLEGGAVTLNYYGSGESPTTEPTATYDPSQYLYSRFVFGGSFAGDPELPGGWYQFGFRESSFSTETFSSEIFALDGQQQYHSVTIRIYVDEVDTVDIFVQQAICHDPERAGTTDIVFLQLDPESISATATSECRNLTPLEMEGLSYTLTNTETNESIVADVTMLAGLGIVFPAVPAGTYTISETTSGVTSDPFTVDAARALTGVIFYSYVDEPVSEPTEGDPYLGLSAITCIDDARAGDFEFVSIANQPIEGEPVSISGAASVGMCTYTDMDDLEFELATLDEPGTLSAAAVYPLVRSQYNPFIFTYVEDGDEAPVPSGTYVVREVNSGNVSEPILFSGDSMQIQYMVFQAGPTPTPTETLPPTETPEPTATATSTPDDPDATATATATPDDPDATATATATLDPDGNVGPGGGDSDGDGIPDGDDPDDDNDGTPDSEDPDDDNDGIPDTEEVNELPSTGQGTSTGTTSGLLFALLAGAVILFGIAIRTGRQQRG